LAVGRALDTENRLSYLKTKNSLITTKISLCSRKTSNNAEIYQSMKATAKISKYNSPPIRVVFSSGKRGKSPRRRSQRVIDFPLAGTLTWHCANVCGLLADVEYIG
jgi:hypothetical protein